MNKVKQPKPSPDFKKMYQLAEHYSEASSLLEQQAKGEEWGCSAPRLVVDSFAVELYLKCLFVIDTNTAPLKEHDWVKLFDALLPNTQTAIREEFERIINSDPFLPYLRQFPAINPNAVRFTDFKLSLISAKNTFVKSRYLYQAQPNEEWGYAQLIPKAIRSVATMVIPFAGLNKSCG
jgi:hypothetical protein